MRPTLPPLDHPGWERLAEALEVPTDETNPEPEEVLWCARSGTGLASDSPQWNGFMARFTTAAGVVLSGRRNGCSPIPEPTTLAVSLKYARKIGATALLILDEDGNEVRRYELTGGGE